MTLNEFGHWIGQVLALTYFIGLFWLIIGGIFVKSEVFKADPKGLEEAMNAFGGEDDPEGARKRVSTGYYLALLVYAVIWPIFLFFKKKKAQDKS